MMRSPRWCAKKSPALQSLISHTLVAEHMRVKHLADASQHHDGLFYFCCWWCQVDAQLDGDGLHVEAPVVGVDELVEFFGHVTCLGSLAPQLLDLGRQRLHGDAVRRQLFGEPLEFFELLLCRLVHVGTEHILADGAYPRTRHAQILGDLVVVPSCRVADLLADIDFVDLLEDNPPFIRVIVLVAPRRLLPG